MNRFEANWDVIKEYMRVTYGIPNDEYTRYILPLKYRGSVGYTQIIGVPKEIEDCILHLKEEYYTKLHQSITTIMRGYWGFKLFPESEIIPLMYAEKDKQMKELHIDPIVHYAW